MVSAFIDYQPEDQPESVVLARRSPVARIGHVCAECDGGIVPGERYEVTVVIEDGEFITHKCHAAGQCCSPHDWR